MKENIKHSILVAVLLLASACAPKAYRMEADVVWPPAPDTPRIKYVESFFGTNYFAPEWSEGVINSIVGDNPSTVLYKPAAVTGDDKGNVYVSDGPGYVMVLDREKETVRIVGDRGQGKIFGVAGLAFHNGRNELYACDTIRKVVHVLDPEANKLKRQFAGMFTKPVGVAVDEPGDRLAVADAGAHNVKVLDLKSGNLLFTIGKRGNQEGEFNIPLAVAFDDGGRIYVSDTMNFRVQIFDENGEFLRMFGSIGLYPGQFSRPKGIGLDSSGHVYVADAAFGNVQIFDPETGDLLLAFGSNGFGPGEFRLPHGLFIDKNDRIHVVDQINRRVQIFQYLTRAEGKRLEEERPEEETEE